MKNRKTGIKKKPASKKKVGTITKPVLTVKVPESKTRIKKNLVSMEDTAA